MPYRSPHSGGLVHLCVIRCGACGALTPPALDANSVRALARDAGWDINHNRPLEPRCPDCHHGLLAAG